MYSNEWGGLPDKEFLGALHPQLAGLRDRLYQRACSADTAAGHLCEEWAKKLGLKVFDFGTGIAHVIIMEEGYAFPGALCLFGDSHANAYGAVGALGAQCGLEMLEVYLTGKLWFRVPETHRYVIEGQTATGVYSRDVIQHIVGEVGMDASVYKAIEWDGSNIHSLPIPLRFPFTLMTVELGAKSFSIPSAGNAAGALSAYAALASIPAYVFMPKDVPRSFIVECDKLGAHVQLVDGLITDCGRMANEQLKLSGRFDISTLKEPYRVEGKKTMGYELAEQMDWELPDVIIYPTGGGTGLVGMWKAFEEMQQLGWIGSKRPRMVAVQAAGCAPLVKAFNSGKEHADFWEDAKTIADGLRVPAAVGDFLIIRILKKSHGTAITVTDEEMLNGVDLIGQNTGLFVSPESGATVAALRKLCNQHWIKGDERIVLFNTGSSYKYSHLWSG